MTTSWDRAISVRTAGMDTWHADLVGNYAFEDKLNGGYLIAVAANAARAAVADADPTRADARLD